MEMSGKMWVMAIAVGALLVVSLVQAVELIGLTSSVEGLNTGGITTTKQAAPKSSSSSGDTLQKSIQNLPGMVGGC
ncbi:MAG: hypothetical protein GOV01_00730 [Candidatus Altiarchaeota archaeon]|nr:hypothetical protein [Candidatus Altiarchaeota archaeon]